jgi:hypothetical protein
LSRLGFRVFGKPNICVIGFIHNKYSPTLIQDYMKERKWQLSLNQKPISFHFSITPLNSTRVDDMVKDFQECIKYLDSQKLSNSKDTGMLELYGACAKIPDGHTKTFILANLIDCFLDI